MTRRKGPLFSYFPFKWNPVTSSYGVRSCHWHHRIPASTVGPSLRSKWHGSVCQTHSSHHSSTLNHRTLCKVTGIRAQLTISGEILWALSCVVGPFCNVITPLMITIKARPDCITVDFYSEVLAVCFDRTVVLL